MNKLIISDKIHGKVLAKFGKIDGKILAKFGKMLRAESGNLALAINLVLLVEQRLQGEPVKSGENSASRLALEVHPAADHSVVLAARVVQVDAGHFAGRKVDVTDVGDAACNRCKKIIFVVLKGQWPIL